MDNIYIGITDSKKFDDYSRWILSANPEIHIIRLSYHHDNVSEVVKCNGIILTGGEDVHPEYYGKANYVSLLDINQMNRQRDEFELQIIEKALLFKKPLLGICRGLQLTNVFFGGTLIPDIPTILGNSQHGKVEGRDQLHEVNLISDSYIHHITSQDSGIANSAHHQAADEIGKGLKVTAYSNTTDNIKIVEALEWEQPENKSWLLLVQWHPERIAEDELFSKKIRSAFLKEANNLHK